MKSLRFLLPGLAICWGAATSSALALPAALQPVTVRSTDQPASTAADGASGAPLLAGNDRYLFFVSEARNLVTNTPAPSGAQVYRRDRVTGETLWVSTDGGLSPKRIRRGYAVSEDGQRVAFEASLPGSQENIYLRDLAAGTTTLISLNQDQSGPGNGASWNPSLSADGRYVVFETTATDLAPGMQDGQSALCLRDLLTGETRLIVSLSSPGGVRHEVSRDGGLVVYSRVIDAEQRPGFVDTRLVVWHRQDGQTEDVLLPLTNPEGLRPAVIIESFRLSEDGSHLALVPIASGSFREHLQAVWHYPVAGGSAERVMAINLQWITELSLSADGRRLSFLDLPYWSETSSIHLWTPDTELETLSDLNQTSRLELSPNGSLLLFHTDEPVPSAGVTTSGVVRAYLRDLATGATRLVASDEQDIEGAFSSDHTLLAFQTSQSLDAGDDNAESDVYLLTLSSGIPELISRRDLRPSSDLGTGNSVTAAGISDDGRWLPFLSGADDLVPHDHNGHRDVFVHDRQTGTNRLVSVSLDGTSARFGADWASISPDGRSILFLSRSPDLVQGDTNTVTDAFVRDWAEERTELISAEHATTTSLGMPVQWAVLTSDRRRVLFEVQPLPMPNPPFGDTIFPPRLLLRDRRTGHTTDLLDGLTNFAGYPLPYVAGSGRIAREGSVVVFTGAFAGLSEPAQWIPYLRDLRTGALETLPLPPESRLIGLSADGRRVLAHTGSDESPSTYSIVDRTQPGAREFSAPGARNVHFNPSGTHVLYLAPFNSALQIFVLAPGDTAPQPVYVGRGGTLANADCLAPRMSPDGRFILFRSQASNLVEGDTNGVMEVFLHDRYSATTQLLSVNAEGLPGEAASFGGVLNATGTTFAFATASARFTPGEAGRFTQILTGEVVVGPAIDSDQDGLPDQWERDHFAGLAFGPEDDPDEDQQTNGQEFAARTSPNDSRSRVQVETGLDGADPYLRWTGHAGVAYQVESRDSLSDGSGWAPAGDVLPGHEGLIEHRLPETSGGGFFRLTVVP